MKEKKSVMSSPFFSSECQKSSLSSQSKTPDILVANLLFLKDNVSVCCTQQPFLDPAILMALSEASKCEV